MKVKNLQLGTRIRAYLYALYRDGAGQISCDPRTKHLNSICLQKVYRPITIQRKDFIRALTREFAHTRIIVPSIPLSPYNCCISWSNVCHFCWTVLDVFIHKHQLIYLTPVNRPETGGTVPIFAAMSCCPANYVTCPEFLLRRPFFGQSASYGGHAWNKRRIQLATARA